jgi:hypothetical protein
MLLEKTRIGSGQRKGWPKSDQNFQADFNRFHFVLIALKVIEIPGNSQLDQIIYELAEI